MKNNYGIQQQMTLILWLDYKEAESAQTNILHSRPLVFALHKRQFKIILEHNAINQFVIFAYTNTYLIIIWGIIEFAGFCLNGHQYHNIAERCICWNIVFRVVFIHFYGLTEKNIYSTEWWYKCVWFKSVNSSIKENMCKYISWICLDGLLSNHFCIEISHRYAWPSKHLFFIHWYT